MVNCFSIYSNTSIKVLAMMVLWVYLLNKIVVVGPDQVKFCIHMGSNGSTNDKPIDEIEEYWSGRYLAATKGIW